MSTTTYVLDTNVLLSDSNALLSFEEHDLVLPLIVIEELDRHKDRQDETGRNARETARKLAALTEGHKNFGDGIPIGNGLGKIRLLSVDNFNHVEKVSLPSELAGKVGDNQILEVTWLLRKSGEEAVLVTRDILLRLKATTLDIPVQDYKKLSVAKSVSSLYTGISKIELDFDIDEFYSTGQLELPEELTQKLLPNQFLVLKQVNPFSTENHKSALVRWTGKKVQPVVDQQVSKISAKNKEQRFALDLLLDDKVLLATLSGKAGCGKTLLAIAAGLHQVLNTKKYKSLVVCRPIQPVGNDIGYLPGSSEEKMLPWIAPIKDNLRTLLSHDGKKTKRSEETLDLLFENGTIEVQVLTYIRGRSISNAFMIIDEAQNLTAHELKTIITRVGEGTKIVLTGDIEQIDSMNLDSVTNGLTVCIEKFKHSDMTGHITLIKGERSALASLAADLL